MSPGRIPFFFFTPTAPTEIYTLSLHDALPIFAEIRAARGENVILVREETTPEDFHGDRKSTRLNSSHQIISYAVFCLKKKKENDNRKVEVDVRTPAVPRKKV